LEKYSIDDSADLSDSQKETIRNNLKQIFKNVSEAGLKSPFKQTTRILLATKTRSPEEINFAISQGIDLIGENRVQELLAKYDNIDKDHAEIHFIGALQTNKVKYIIDKVSMIHSLDRISLAEEIDRQAKKIGKVMDVLVEVNIGSEESKSGLQAEELLPFLEKLSVFEHLHVCGLMIIPPKLTSISTQKQYFQKIMNLYIDISAKKIDNVNMTVLSMGMSSDYPVAVECGSTLVRIGTAAFGKRI